MLAETREAPNDDPVCGDVAWLACVRKGLTWKHRGEIG